MVVEARDTRNGIAGDGVDEGETADPTANPVHEVADAVRQTYAGYSPSPRPFGTFTALVVAFNALFAAFLLVTKRRNQPLPERIAFSDLFLLGLATHKLSRLLTKDKVTVALRAPFTRYDAPGQPGEVEEEARGHGVRRGIGELISCPYCIAVWLASFLHYGLVFQPRVTRLLASIFSAVALSDFLQAAYVLATSMAEQQP